MTRFCSQCGATVLENARFCNKCGAQLAPTQPQSGVNTSTQYTPPTQQDYQQTSSYNQYPYQQPYQQPYQAQSPSAGSAGDLKSNIAGMLCYPLSFLTGIIFLVLSPYNRDRFIKFHAYQSIFFFAALFVANIVFSIVLPWPLERTLAALLRLAFLVGTGFSMYKAYQGEKFKLPLIGDFAEQQADK
jgi:uncharacterized membrane protein